MPVWAFHLFWIAAGIEGVISLVLTRLAIRHFESTRILDWGPQPTRILRMSVCAAAVLTADWMAWSMRAALTEPAATGAFIFITCMGLKSFPRIRSHLGLFESGIQASLRDGFGLTVSFIEWSKIKHYQWTEQGTLIVNPGWFQSIWLIPPDDIAEVVAVLKTKCPDAELMTPVRTP